MAYSRGTWAADAKGPDGNNVSLNGHWVTVAKCQGDMCLMTVHNGNTAMPPPSDGFSDQNHVARRGPDH